MNDNIIDFLIPDIKSIRKSIKGIDDSYNNFWDILAELLQNSVDAITKKREILKEKNNEFNIENDEEYINIDIDCIKQNIKVKDSGIGMKREDVPTLLRPFSTNKEDDFNVIGEKGVGLKYVIFQSKKFSIKTSYLDSEDATYMIINDAKQWKNAESDEYLKLEEQEFNGYFDGTEIEVSGVDNEELFGLDFTSMKFLLRTKTAVGNV